MSTVINTNLASLFAQNSLANAQNNLATSVQRLSSGLRINSAKDDAAGLSIAQNMQGQINGVSQSIRNLSDATNLLQVADSSLSSIQDMLLRMKQLSVQGYDGSLSASQKLNIVQEMKDLNDEINATAQRTSFNGISLLTSGASLDLVNTDIKSGASLSSQAVQINTTSGLGAYSTLNDGANTKVGGNGQNTTYWLQLDPALSPKTPGTYTLQNNGSNLTLTGTFNGQAQSQTVSLMNATGNPTGGQDATVQQQLNFSNFGIKLNISTVVGAGATETGTQLAAAIVGRSSSIVVDGKGGQISNVRLSGTNPGSYQLTYGNTGSVASLSLPASLASGQTAAGQNSNVALVGGSGSGAKANVVYDANGTVTSIQIANAGTGYKAGDILSTAAITAGTVQNASIVTAPGASAATEKATASFNSLNAGETVTMAGLTFTAGTNGASANQVAAAFANMVNGSTTGAGTQVLNGSGSYSGTFNGWTTGAATGNKVDFTSTVPNTDVQNLAAGAGSASVVVNTTQGSSAATAQAKVTFKGLGAGQSFTLAGLTFTAGTIALTADQVALAFSGVVDGNDTTAANASNVTRTANNNGTALPLSGTTGTFTAGKFAGWGSAGVNRTTTNVPNDTLILTSASPGAAVADLTTSNDPVITTSAGGIGGVTENASVVFSGLNAHETMSLGGLMFTAGDAAVTAGQVASAFAGLANGAKTGAGLPYGSYSGQLNNYSTGAVSGTGSDTVLFTSSIANANVNDLVDAQKGTDPVLVKTQGTLTSTETTTAEFSGITLAAGNTITLGGLTYTAGSNGTSATQLAAAFANLQNGASADTLNATNQSVYGRFSGTFSGWSTGSVAPNGTLITFTSSTPNQNVNDLYVAHNGASPTINVVQGSTPANESASVQYKALAAGQQITMAGLTFTSVAGSSAVDVAKAFASRASGAAPTTIGQTESNVMTFGNMTAGDTITVNGLTYTATADTTAAHVAADFANMASNAVAGGTTYGTWTDAGTHLGTWSTGAANGNSVTFTYGTADVAATGWATSNTVTGGANAPVVENYAGAAIGGNFSGALTGWNTGALSGSNNDTLTWTSTTPSTDVNNLTAVLPQNPTITKVTNGAATANESALVTFSALSAGQKVTLGGMTFTATADATANDVATAFENGNAAGAYTHGTLTGTLTGWATTGHMAGAGNTMIFDSTVLGSNVDDLATPVAGAAPTVVTTQQGGSTNSTEAATVTFGTANMSSGDSITIGGLTFTASQDGVTQSQVANLFSGLNDGQLGSGISTSLGQFSGQLSGWNTGVSSGGNLVFTSTTPSSDVQDLTSSVTQRKSLNALDGIVVGNLANQTGDNLLTISGMVGGALKTQSITLSDNKANGSQTISFDSFGIQFDVDSFQAQSANEIGAALASLNSSSAVNGSTGAFKPGQIVVGQGANSALKFQSGANSEAYIQIDTINVQTGNNGVSAGTDKPMIDVGTRIASSGAGNLGALGLSDSIDTWQTAFKNAADAVDQAVEYVSTKRATYGSQMNRLSYISTNLTAQSTNLQNSRSAIMDTDFAAETAKLTKGQIMQQAATAMLAQANQMPNVILSLLK